MSEIFNATCLIWCVFIFFPLYQGTAFTYSKAILVAILLYQKCIPFLTNFGVNFSFRIFKFPPQKKHDFYQMFSSKIPKSSNTY